MNAFLFQSPYKYLAFVISSSVIAKVPRFFEFELNADGTNYKTAELMEDPAYIKFNAAWNDLWVMGWLPLIFLAYFNFKIYLEESWLSLCN